MQKKFLYFTCLLLAFAVISTNAQTISGYVFDESTGLTLPAATVYQDGTTNVTATDETGKFTLDSKGLDNALMIRYVGYHTKRIDHPLQYEGKVIKLFLNEQSTTLDEVVIGKEGPFTRRELLRAFRDQFLGTSIAASRCKITNEDDLILRYNVAKKTLTATARQPLQMINNHLEYEISFDLVELVTTYKNTESLHAHFVSNSYFSGSTFYTDISKNNKVNKKRLEAFYGSTAHFMRALAYGNLKEEQWEIYVGGKTIQPEIYFEITDTLQYKKVKLIKKPERLVMKKIGEEGFARTNRFATQGKVDSTAMVSTPDYFMPYYHRQKQSIMEFLTPEIYVDPNGNFTPIYGVIFGGYLGSLKAGDLLPIEYFQTIKEIPNPSEK